MAKKKKLGQLLIEAGAITEEQLQQGLEKQKKEKAKIGKILTQLGFVDETTMMNILAAQLHVPFIELKYFEVKQDVVRKLPESLARRFKAIPLDKVKNGYLVAMTDPTDLIAYDEISRKLKGNIRPVLVRETDLSRILDQIYRRTEDIVNFASEIAEEVDIFVEEEELSEEGKSAAVARLIETIFQDAVQVGASDIHIEPDKEELRIRMRVDGMLQEQVMKELSIANAIVLRIKLMSKLNISERRLPQDGRFSYVVSGKRFDVRVSTMPVQFGESVVMRILDQSDGVLFLNEIDMPEKIREGILHHIHRPHGMILVTGPTGSGKTTTLYASLSELNKPETKIVTVEDPIEYSLGRVSQVQIQPKIGLDFARVLRACLRQDPDVVMVGEIRDEETATISLRAALTGHLVFSTLHTNDAISAAVRLIDMGIEPFLVASAVRMILAQRLVRRICQNCIEEYEPSQKEKDMLLALVGSKRMPTVFQKGFGCAQCQKTGYRGRIGVYELVEMDQTLADALRRGDTQEYCRLAREKPGHQTLAESTLTLAIDGKTTIEEVFRMAGDLQADNGDDLLHQVEQKVEETSDNSKG
ncbi:MAG: MSHA biogenesis protein MshE [Legionellales bacterium]|nr:MSHA biogenesis protein MshE [Legionellales bacterium]|tara:strand:+ start:566 stop:2323 length:1758 start_codon:yes stop_codon:yes gene_type:complete